MPAPERAVCDQDVRDLVTGDLGTTFLLEAGAGTGKTRVLVDRYVKCVLDEELGSGDVRTVAAITFTEKAAGELRQRVREEFEARAAKATPGPWRADKSEQVQYRTVGAGFDGRDCVQSWSGSDAHYTNGSRMGDAEFIARAREDVPALIAEVRRLRERIAELEAGDGWTTFYTWQVGEEAEYRIQRRKP